MSHQHSVIQIDNDETASVPHDGQLNTLLDTINLQLNQSPDEERTEVGQEPHAHPHTHSHNEEAQERDIHPAAFLLPFISKFGVFAVILLLKVLYSHRYGLLIMIAAVGTWFYADTTLTTQITLRGHVRHKQFVAKLMLLMIYLSVNLFGIYYFLDDKHFLLYRFAFKSEGLDGEEGTDICALLFLLIMNDYAVKYCTIILKSLLALTPKAIISNQKKAGLYCLLERLTELYRSLLPLIPWYYFLLGTMDGPWFSAVLFIIYIVFKFLTLYKQLLPLKTSIVNVVTGNGSIGQAPSSSELTEAEDNCPVCHEEYTNPTMLICKHIFCEDCILVWLDKETTCPMCRAKIITGDNSYRDGSSSPSVQFF